MLETETDALHPCPATEPVCQAHDLLCRQWTCRRREEGSMIHLGTTGAVSQEERLCPDARGGMMTEQIAPKFADHIAADLCAKIQLGKNGVHDVRVDVCPLCSVHGSHFSMYALQEALLVHRHLGKDRMVPFCWRPLAFEAL